MSEGMKTIIEILILIIGFLMTIIQCIGVYYFKEIRDEFKDLSHNFFVHRHEGCQCSIDGKGDVYIPAKYQKD